MVRLPGVRSQKIWTEPVLINAFNIRREEDNSCKITSSLIDDEFGLEIF